MTTQLTSLGILLSLLSALPTQAQERSWEQLYPLEVGDSWEYELSYGSRFAPIELTSYHRRTVLRDTVLGGDPYMLVRVDSVSADPGHEVLAEALCAVRVTETGIVEWSAVDLSGGGTCWAPEATYGLNLQSGSPDGNESYIHGQLYELQHIDTWAGGSPQETFRAARDFGLIGWSYGPWDISEYFERFVLRAIHAEVGGEEYGHPIGSAVWQAFYPLVEGDIRDYELRESWSEGASTEYERWNVGSDTTIDGDSYTIVRQRVFNDQLDLTDDRRCAMRLDAGRVTAIRIDTTGTCRTGIIPWADLRTNTWTITEREWAGRTLLSKTFRKDDSSGLREAEFGEGVGVLSQSRNDYGGPGTYSTSLTLLYAIANGTTYGEPLFPVSNEEEAAPAVFALSTAYPNPLRTALQFALTLPASDAVTIEAFDVLGRRVLHRELGSQGAGVSVHRMDFSELPAGAYIIRATTASGEAASQRVTKIE